MSPTPILAKTYVEQRDRGYWIAGTRISLDSIAYGFRNGDSPEAIAQNFPLLSLEQVYGAIAFYLANQELIDRYLTAGEQELRELQASLNSPLRQKLIAAKQQQR